MKKNYCKPCSVWTEFELESHLMGFLMRIFQNLPLLNLIQHLKYGHSGYY